MMGFQHYLNLKIDFHGREFVLYTLSAVVEDTTAYTYTKRGGLSGDFYCRSVCTALLFTACQSIFTICFSSLRPCPVTSLGVLRQKATESDCRRNSVDLSLDHAHVSASA